MLKQLGKDQGIRRFITQEFICMKGKFPESLAFCLTLRDISPIVVNDIITLHLCT